MGNTLKSKGSCHNRNDGSSVTFTSIKISYQKSEKRIQDALKSQADDSKVADDQISKLLGSVLNGTNVDHLYSEVLYALTRPRHYRIKQSEAADLIPHLQQVFHIDHEKHDALLEGARKKQARPQVVNLEQAAHKYKHVLHLVLVHELQVENLEPYKWEGPLNSRSLLILKTLESQKGLNKSDIEFAQWLVYTRVHCVLPLNTKFIPALLQTVIQHVQNKLLVEVDLRKFWFATERILESFFVFIRNRRCCRANESVTSQISHMLKTMEILKQFLIGNPNSASDVGSNITLAYLIKNTENAISDGANELFDKIPPLNPEEETEVEHMVAVAQLLIDDLKTVIAAYHSDFQKSLGLCYFDIIYLIYDKRYSEIVKPVVVKLCGQLKHINLKNDDEESGQDKYISIGTTLFSLYLAVKSFADFSSKLSCGDENKDLRISGVFHNWFHSAVGQWLDISWFKAKKRIRKAVQLDTLKLDDDYLQFTSSALDTAHIFHQIVISWNELSWPEVEGAYTFTATMIDDICQCTIFYADLMCKKIDVMEKRTELKYSISDELCLAINNIVRVAEEIDPITEKLGVEIITARLAHKNVKPFSEELNLVTKIENAKLHIDNKIVNILQNVGLKMRPVIQNLLLEANHKNREEVDIKHLINYLDDSLIKLKNNVKPGTFDKAFIILWENTTAALLNLATANIQKQRPSNCFRWLQDMLQILTNFFYPNTAGEIDYAHNSNVQQIENLIRIYGPTTAELIIKYYQQRYKTQVEMTDKIAMSASLTIRTDYCEDIQTLRIEILNARNLNSLYDLNGNCNPYVKIKLIPEDNFATLTVKLKTKAQKKTLFPLFDEQFFVSLSPNELFTGGILMFSLKDNAKFGKNVLLGECFLPLELIPNAVSTQNLQQLPQTHLPFTLPKISSDVVLQTLQNRSWDKSAVKFIKMERTKMVACPISPSYKSEG